MMSLLAIILNREPVSLTSSLEIEVVHKDLKEILSQTERWI